MDSICPSDTLEPPVSCRGVSIVIPAYNYARFIGEAIDSALAQTYKPVEVVVVDDGSTDNTAEIVKSYQDARVRYVYQSNAGLSAARNTGIKEARYPFVSFLDADDKLLPEMCERIMALFSTLPSEFSLIGCSMLKMEPDGTLIRSKHPVHSVSRELHARHFILKNRFPCNVIARKEVFAQCGDFDTTLTSSEDRDMWIRIASKHRVYIHGGPLVIIRRHGNSMSRNSDRMKLNMRRVLAKAWQTAKIPRWSPFWLKALSFNHLEVAWMCHDQGRFAKSIYHLLFSLVLWPYFQERREIGQPALFRLRSFARFLINAATGTPQSAQAGFAAAPR